MKKSIVTFVALLLLPVCTLAQAKKLQNRPYADQKLFHPGFFVGLHTQDLTLTQSGFVNENGEVWFSEIPFYSPGFSVGILGDIYLNRYMNLRILPTLHLGSKEVVFREQASGKEFRTDVKNNYISVPLQVKFNGGRVNNYRPYVTVGGYGSLEIGSRKNRPLLLKPYDYGIEAGVGCDFYLPYFKLSPELKFCFGLHDILAKDRTDLIEETLMKYPLSLRKATQRMIVLSFHFE